MKERLLDLLACPEHGGDIRLEAEPRRDGDEILEGTLRARCCGATFPITRGVPRFASLDAIESDKAQTAENFGWEWKHFARRDERYAEQFLGWIAPVRPEFFRGKVVLEGGCGKGRHTLLASEWGARDVVAVDLSEAVDVAFEETRGRDNVHVVQADIYRLPLKRAFDYAFSVGVIHHLPDPRAGFAKLAGRVKSGGHVSVWVYGAENNEWITGFVDPVRTRITSRMSKPALFQVSKIPTALVWLASKGVYGPLVRNRATERLGKKLFYSDYMVFLSTFDWTEQHHIVFDQLVAPTAFYIPRAEFESWWRDIDAQDLQLSQHNQNSWRGFARLP